MGRSYLFPGRNTSDLTPAEKQLETLYDRLDVPGRRIAPADFFKLPEYGQWLATNYGDLSNQIPPGSQIINQTPFKIEFKDAEGYTHTLTRAGAEAASSGAINRQTNRPAVLPNTAQQDFINSGLQRLQAALSNPVTLAQLPPEVQQQLDAISANERARNAQEQQTAQGDLLARLYGNNVQQSSIANEGAARFAQLAGLVNQQQQSDAAARQLGVQQYLTGLGQQQNQDLASLLANLSGQANQRDIANAGFDLNQQQLAENARQFNASDYLNQLGYSLQKRQLDQQGGLFNNILKGIGAAGTLASGIGTGLGAYNALFKPKPSLPYGY